MGASTFCSVVLSGLLSLHTPSSCLQARAIVDGLPGDIVALALPLDVQKIADEGLIEPHWQVCLCWLSAAAVPCK